MHFDISWDEVAKYVVATPDTVKAAAALIKRFPDRFLFGTDEVGAEGPAEVPARVRDVRSALAGAHAGDEREGALGNYERLFDEARREVRAWEQANVH